MNSRLWIVAGLVSLLLVPGTASAQGSANNNRPDAPPGLENRSSSPPGHDRAPSAAPGQPAANGTPPQQGGEPPADNGSPSQAAGAATQADSVYEAVETGRAVPFGHVLDHARQSAGGDFIDARLVSERGVLLYEVLMLREDGTVEHLYYDAETGNPMVR